MPVDPPESLADAVAPYLDVNGPPSLSRDPLNETAIRYFCEVVEDANPVYWDADVARESVFGRIIAPPQALWSIVMPPFWSPDYVSQRNRRDATAFGGDQDEAPVPRSAMTVIAERGYTALTVVEHETEFHAPFGPGDGRVVARHSVVAVSEPKRTRVGEGVFVTSVTEYSVEVGDRPVGRQRSTIMMYNPAGPRKEAGA